MTASATPQPEAHEALLTSLSGLAPFAMFMLLSPQGGSDEAKTRVFTERLFAPDTHRLIQAMIGALHHDPAQRFAILLADPEMPRRALAAAGARLATHDEGPAARDAFMNLALEIASTGDPVGDDVMANIEAHLDAGSHVALAGADPFPEQPLVAYDFGDIPHEVIQLAAFGPVAAFIFVAGADGHADPREIAAFIEGLQTTKSPCLQSILLAVPMTVPERMKALAEKKDLSKASLQALATIFQQVDGGIEAREELLKTLEAIAKADGVFDANERQMIDLLARLFDGREMPAATTGPRMWVQVVMLGWAAATFFVMFGLGTYVPGQGASGVWSGVGIAMFGWLFGLQGLFFPDFFIFRLWVARYGASSEGVLRVIFVLIGIGSLPFAWTIASR